MTNLATKLNRIINQVVDLGGRAVMLGERSEQRGLWEADRLYIDHVGRGELLRSAGLYAWAAI